MMLDDVVYPPVQAIEVASTFGYEFVNFRALPVPFSSDMFWRIRAKDDSRAFDVRLPTGLIEDRENLARHVLERVRAEVVPQR